MCVINNPTLQAPTVFLNILCLYLGDTLLYLRILLHIRRISIIEIVVKGKNKIRPKQNLVVKKSKMALYQNPSLL